VAKARSFPRSRDELVECAALLNPPQPTEGGRRRSLAPRKCAKMILG
jgi:hypothetical protein